MKGEIFSHLRGRGASLLLKYRKCAEILGQGLAAQSKAEAIGQNKISSANQRPGFQMIFFSFWSGLIYCYELCVYGSKVMIVVEYSVHEQHMNPFICPFPLEKD